MSPQPQQQEQNDQDKAITSSTSSSSSSGSASSSPRARIIFRGQKFDYLPSLTPQTTVAELRQFLVSQQQQQQQDIEPEHIQLILKGRVLRHNDDRIADYLPESVFSNHQHQSNKSLVVTIIASGLSPEAQQQLQEEKNRIIQSGPRVKDDLTPQGLQEIQRRHQLAQRHMHQRTARNIHNTQQDFGFQRIQVLPNLPHMDQARQILEQLASDPGILACMKHHQWTVGCLSELYPQGQVGHSPVCVMGLNQNKGQTILLRLRTDDLQGFRKISSIRKVLYHELAHNVHSDHNQDFFQLMRQVERECLSMDWTNGNGISKSMYDTSTSYQGGTYRLGGGGDPLPVHSQRELLALKATERLMTQEEAEEIKQNCGCGGTQQKDLFLPKKDE